MTTSPPPEKLALQVEAVLFASGRPLNAREIAEAIGTGDARKVSTALHDLEEGYRSRPTALELRRVGDRYSLQLAEEFVPTVQSVTPMEMAPRTLKTLTLVAYHQPILQSLLVRMMGDGAYEEVARLRGMGLVHTEAKGSTLELSTTRRFIEYFGLESSRTEDIRKFLETKLGVPPTAPPATTASPSEPLAAGVAAVEPTEAPTAADRPATPADPASP